MWGNLNDFTSFTLTWGPIPTRVGEPVATLVAGQLAEAYPHACGGTDLGIGDSTAIWGLSPRVWGNQCSPPRAASDVGPIPTRVGEPPCSTTTDGVRQAYPHACGGTKPSRQSDNGM